MNVYLVKRTGRVGYDEYDGVVVVAESEANAIELAYEYSPLDEVNRYGSFTQDGSNVTVHPVQPDERRVVLASFNAG